LDFVEREQRIIDIPIRKSRVECRAFVFPVSFIHVSASLLCWESITQGMKRKESSISLFPLQYDDYHAVAAFLSRAHPGKAFAMVAANFRSIHPPAASPYE
jgi:hypothetical protein